MRGLNRVWRLRGLNPALVTGLLLLGGMFFLAAVGPKFAPYERDFSDNFIYVDTEEGREMYVSPVKPMELFPLGSDPYGRDILSILMYGARYSVLTTLVVAMFRVTGAAGLVVLAAALRFRGGFPGVPSVGFLVRRTGASHGVAAGRRRGLRGRAENLKGTGVTVGGGGGFHGAGLNAIPQFIILYFILYSINFNSPLTVPVLTVVQWALLVVFGVPGLVPSVSAYVEQLEGMEFVTAARANGAGAGRIFFRHIFPHLKEKLLLLFSQETVAVLTLVGQLGIFNIFIGGTLFTPYPALYHSITYEWAGLVGQYRYKLQPGTWWVLVFPLCGFVLLLLGFYLTSRGLERKVREKHHRVSYL